MCSLIDETAFSSHTNSREWIVSSYHTAGQMCRPQSLDGGGGTRLEPIFEDD